MMSMGAGYFIGGTVLILYAIFCIYVGVKRPEKLFKITKMKLGRNKTDDAVAKIVYVWSGICIVVGIVIYVLGVMNQ